MIENAEIVAARLKSRILKERKSIDFAALFNSLKETIAENIENKQDLPEISFSVVQGKPFLAVKDSPTILTIPKMLYANKIKLFEEIETWIEDNNYFYVANYDKKETFIGFTISWEDYVEVDPFDFNLETDKEIQLEDENSNE